MTRKFVLYALQEAHLMQLTLACTNSIQEYLSINFSYTVINVCSNISTG